MEAVLWIVAVVLVVSGVTLAIRHQMTWGIALILGGMLTGVGAGVVV